MRSGAAARGLITDAAVAGSPEQERNLWELRDELSPAGRFEQERSTTAITVTSGIMMSLDGFMSAPPDYHNGANQRRGHIYRRDRRVDRISFPGYPA